MASSTQASENIRLASQYALMPSCCFRVVSIRNAQGDQIRAIKINGIVRRIFYRIAELFANSKEKRRCELVETIQHSVSCISGLGRDFFIQDGRKTDLFNMSQRFNQVLQVAQGSKGSVFEKSSVNFIEPKNEDVKRELAFLRPQVEERKSAQEADQPLKVGVRYRYPTDIGGHALEAVRIFLCTQAERIASLFCKRYRYFREGVTETDVCVANAPLPAKQTGPSSYWVGHSTCFISIPVKEQKNENKVKTVNILTDPVEGSLNVLFYPRKTQPGRKIEDLPAVHIMLLSHNHLDHYSETTVKKLLSMQPVIVVPEGDRKLFTTLGFKNVYEQKWWDSVDVTLVTGDEKYSVSVTAVPSHHWAGQGFYGVGSYFVGHVIGGIANGGNIYYAGDTARLNGPHVKALRDRFDIRWMYQPGGPDEMRADMESTHQSSADSLWAHMELFLKKALNRHHGSKKEFLTACEQSKTILMHTSTFKLGNLHADDTKISIEHVLQALEFMGTKKEGLCIRKLRSYEQRVLEELCSFRTQVIREIGEDFSYKELATLLREGVFVPKIGARTDFDKRKVDQKNSLQF